MHIMCFNFVNCMQLNVPVMVSIFVFSACCETNYTNYISNKQLHWSKLAICKYRVWQRIKDHSRWKTHGAHWYIKNLVYFKKIMFLLSKAGTWGLHRSIFFLSKIVVFSVFNLINHGKPAHLLPPTTSVTKDTRLAMLKAEIQIQILDQQTCLQNLVLGCQWISDV